MVRICQAMVLVTSQMRVRSIISKNKVDHFSIKDGGKGSF